MDLISHFLFKSTNEFFTWLYDSVIVGRRMLLWRFRSVFIRIDFALRKLLTEALRGFVIPFIRIAIRTRNSM
jgi:hypothetical protein